ncbi:MAG: GTP-binding protein [Hyphomicrobiaceae bacterium]|nr:GTP-binding protein [Hyphomicrobiaceae bacterium]
MRIPVTLLCGYLGAGKTTVINHLLSAPDSPRITVLVNDFGSINVDARLIADRGADTITLTNGCACCSIDDDLGTALQAQLERAASIARIVIEASGVAEPQRLARSVEAWPGLRLDRIATVVDAGAIQARAQDKFVGRLVRRQVEAADAIVLNKIDLAGESRLAETRAWLRTQAPDSQFIEVEKGAVASRWLFGAPSPAARRTDGGEHTPHFHTTTVPLHAGLELAALRRILVQAPAGIHRIKGFVRDPAGRTMLVQGEGGGRISLEPYDTHDQPAPMALVCIATDRASLDTLSQALAELVHAVQQPAHIKTAPAT